MEIRSRYRALVIRILPSDKYEKKKCLSVLFRSHNAPRLSNNEE